MTFELPKLPPGDWVIISPNRGKRKRAKYTWVLASQCPDDKSDVYVRALSDHPEITDPKPEDFYNSPFVDEPSVMMRRIKKQA
jgi:hypothetical protein